METLYQFQKRNLKHTLLSELQQIAGFIEAEDFSSITQIYGTKGMGLIVSKLKELESK